VTVHLKICGLTRPEDLDACERLGVDAIGLNFWSGSKRALSLADARALLSGRTRSCLRVGVFVDASPDDVARTFEALDLDVVQLHGDAPIDPFAALGLPYVQVVRGTPDLATLALPSPPPRWVLLDALVPGFGGTGTRTDWTWAAAAVRHLSPTPVWLAGGIDPDNAAQAIAAVSPAGLDVASGAEPPDAAHGEKDAVRIAALLQICASAGKTAPGDGD
jgi:phosphoribosylanthranilate isomerase